MSSSVVAGADAALRAQGASAVFDLDAAWMVSPQVALRPERFGALAYHFGTRRLSFLKSPHLLSVVSCLADHASAREACEAVGLDAAQTVLFGRALGTLAATDMIVLRGAV